MKTINNKTKAHISFEMIDNTTDEDNFIIRNNSFIPEKVTLTWSSLTIRATVKSYLSLPRAILNKKFERKRSETILNSCHGIMVPGTLTALIGPRLIFPS